MITNNFFEKKIKFFFQITFYFFIFTNFVNAQCTSDINPSQSNIKNIKVEFYEYRNWIKNLTRILIKPNDSVKLRKKRFKANIIFEIKDNSICKFPASVRSHGDLNDHLELINGNLISSLNINLKKGNIDNITKFILFVPKSRGFDNEIFVATLLKELNYLSPTTFYTDVTVGQIKSKYIFQEKIEKEFLERNKKIEGPIIEGYENFYKTYKMPARISNIEWVKSSQNKIAISAAALSDLNNFIFNHNNSKKEWSSENDLLSLDNKYLNIREKIILNSYETFLFALDIVHGASISDRRFYYDIIYDEFYPIYYDGSSKILDNLNLRPLRFKNLQNSDDINQIFNPYPKPYVTKEAWLGTEYALNLILNLNVDKFYDQLKINNLKIEKKIIVQKLDLIKKRINKIKKNQPLNSNFEFPKNFYSNFFIDEIKFNKFIFLNEIIDNNLEIQTCNFNLSKCIFDKISLENFKNFLEQKNQNFEYEKLFISNDFSAYNNGVFTRSAKKLKKFNNYKYKNINLSTNEFVDHNIDFENNLLELNYLDADGRAIISYSSLKNFKIKFNNNFTNSNSKETNFYGITGCLLISDSVVENISIEGSGSACEDAVNFLRTDGNIKLLKVTSSSYDAIDADFSNLNFKKIIVENSGNDCLDLSYGKYSVIDVFMNNCGDKGISVGEKSLLNLQGGIIQNIEIGVASKDQSLANIKNLEIINYTKKCFMKYQKKQEFGKGELFSENVICDRES